MDELRTQQLEALQVAVPYCSKMITAINNIMKEYTQDRLPDTDEYALGIVNGLNWLFEVFNGTQSLINKDEKRIDKDVVNAYALKLNEANQNNDDAARSEALKGLLTFVEQFKVEAERLSA